MKPVKKKRTKFALERNMARAEEVEKLLKAWFVEEVYYPNWLAKVVLVKKSNGKWRMCVDFTDLNKACPKDSFFLPCIYVLVDSMAGYGLLSFMDVFSGYNQIYMHPEDHEKTAFITDRACTATKSCPLKAPPIFPSSHYKSLDRTKAVSVSITETIPEWQRSIVEYLEKGILSLNKKLATQMRIRAVRFTIVNGTLYKRGFMMSLLKCISKEEGDYVLREIHERICDSYSGARVLTHKVVRVGFYWPNMSRDSIMGGSLTMNHSKNGVPSTNYYSFPGHPQVNGQVEATNKTIFKILKKKLGDQKGDWADDLLEVLWAYRTMKRTPTDETPYALAFDTEAVIPAEITIATKDPAEGKLAPNWEGPYRVIEYRRAGAYYLENLERKALPRPWNAEYLKKYFV
ncbi:uncharacterized protein LOC132162878 [Corylus avellana]|uniref:uncharacterized protein LOC132162878 n=1 Tax=Corylus avellana TaxID=13451 RepID=UPI00286B8065|nr:uncharacterized protein LOC132162878 [Corylus avellana]